LNWQPIRDYESLYEVNENGDVRSLHKRNFHQLLSQRIDRGGYLTVSVSKHGKDTTLYVHRILGMAFIPNPENKPFINHKNGIRTDNSLANLEWVNQSENILHAYNCGLIKKKSKPVVDTCSGIEFESCKVAAFYYGIEYNTLRGYLNGQISNPTCLQYSNVA
jgi:hypothetical protein